MTVSKIEQYMDSIFIEEYNPEFIKQSIVMYETGDTVKIDPEKAIDLINNYQRSISEGVLSINFKFDYKKIQKVVDAEYNKIVKNIINPI